MALKLNVATPRNGSNFQDLDNLYVVWKISKHKPKLIVFNLPDVSSEKRALLKTLLTRLLLNELWKQIISQFSRFLMGWIMNLKQKDIESVMRITAEYDVRSEGSYRFRIIVDNPIFTILALLWHATILILSAVEGLNGFKKLNIKRY